MKIIKKTIPHICRNKYLRNSGVAILTTYNSRAVLNQNQLSQSRSVNTNPPDYDSIIGKLTQLQTEQTELKNELEKLKLELKNPQS